MYAHLGKLKENISMTVANSVGQKKSKVPQDNGFVDNRPVTVAQRKLQSMANTPSVSIPIQKNGNKIGLADNLISGMESLSGYSMDKVKPTEQLKNKVNVNDDLALEKVAGKNGTTVQRLIISIEHLTDRRKIIAKSALAYQKSETKFDHAISPHEPGSVDTKLIQQLGVNEPLIIIGHGEQVGYGLKPNQFAGYTAVNLANIVDPILPKDYSGEIFLNGCYTAQKSTGLGFLAKAGVSYIDNFSARLKVLRKDVRSYIRGNKGSAITVSSKVLVDKSGDEVRNRFSPSTISTAKEVNLIGGNPEHNERLGQSTSYGGHDMDSKKNK